jgi:hypothetical protein
LDPILAQFWADFGYDSEPILGPIIGLILEESIGAVGSHGGLKQHKVEKTTKMPPLFEVGGTK